jgi:ElaB/YqjD/DUF883 family membrane-anchored ribosome-binding protein
MSMSNRVERQAENLRSKATETASAVGEAAREMASDVADVAQRRAGEMADVARTHAREVGESVGEVGTQFRQALERSLERQPLTTVLLAMAAGVVLGGILRR